MSGSDVPYQLRPNKFIDRQLFVEALTRLVIPRGVDRYIYVSMGGNHLVDHYAVYSELGIQAQFSFDRDGNAVKRQHFNRPTDATICEEMNSADLPSKIDKIMAAFPRQKSLIVWLDYTSSDRLTQLQEVVETLVRLKHGDIFRVTLNANPFGGGDWKTKRFAGPAECRAGKLREQLGNYMPTSITAIGEDGFAEALSQCVSLAVQEAVRRCNGLRIEPALITSYKDSTPMLTATCTVSDSTSEVSFPAKEFARWKFACKGWDNALPIFAPVLSSRERHKLDSCLKRGPARMRNALPFRLAEDDDKLMAALRGYRDFHRYYPVFRNVDD